MRDPERAARLWLAVAVATLWLLSVGGVAEDDIPEHVAGRDGVVPGTSTDTAGDPPAAGERVSPGLGGLVGRFAAPGAVA